MDELRAKVNNFTAAPSDAMKVYTTANNEVVYFVSDAKSYTDDIRIITGLSDFLFILKWRDLAAYERKESVDILYKGAFDTSSLYELQKIISALDSYEDLFKSSANPTFIKQYEDGIKAEPAVEKVAGIREAIFNNQIAAKAMNAEEVFAIYTAKSGGFSKVQKSVLTTVSNDTSLLIKENGKKFHLYILEFIAMLIAIVGMSTLVIRNLLGSIHSVNTSLEKISHGDVQIDLPSVEGNEIAQMFASVRKLRDAVELNLLMNRMTSDYPVLRCNAKLEITFFNSAAEKTLQEIGLSLKGFANKNISFLSPQLEKSVLEFKNSGNAATSMKLQISSYWLETKINLLNSTSGEFDGVYINLHNITESMRNDESIQLAQSEIKKLIIGVQNGELDSRLEGSKFQGFYKDLALSMNDLVDTMVNPINKSITALNSLAKGDLTSRIDGAFKGSFAQMKDAFNTVSEHLETTMLKIRSATESVNGASNEISSGSLDLSARTEQQASNLEETAASMEEMAKSVNHSSERASNASSLTFDASKLAEKGGADVQKVVDAMNGIEEYANKISDIITVIDEIAFQTNLLALNAAVEAARAGDAGKGFAVVASEVRALAGRSSGASKEIKELITQSNNQIGLGSKLVKQSGTTLTEIVDSVKQVSLLIQDIATSTKEQATGINEMNSAVAQMDEMTQQNAALVEENSAATQSLAEQASELEKLIAFFKVRAGA